MGSNTSITSAMAKSVITGETNINTIISNAKHHPEEQHHHDKEHPTLTKESQWSKSSPALKPTRPYRSSMKRSSRSVPNKMDEAFQSRVKQETQQATSPAATTSTDSSPSSALSSSSPSSTTTPTSVEVQNMEDQNASNSKQTNAKSKNRPNAISYANFLNHSHTLTLADESTQDRYFDRYYPPLPTDVEEKLKVVDKKARPKTANAYVKAKSASNLKITAPSSSSNISIITTESSSPQNNDNNNGSNNTLVAKPLSPIVSLYSKTSPNNQNSTPSSRTLLRSFSHSFGLTSNSSSSTTRNNVSPSSSNTLQPTHQPTHPSQRSSSHSVGLSLNPSKSPTHSPSSGTPRFIVNNNSLQPHHALQRSNSQSTGMVSPSNQKSPNNSTPKMPQTFHKLPSEGTTIVG